MSSKNKSSYKVLAYHDICKMIEEGKYNKGKKCLLEYLDEYPYNVKAKILLIKTFCLLNEIEEAEKLLEYSLEVHYDIPIFNVLAAILYYSKEDYQKAYEHYEKIDFNEYKKADPSKAGEIYRLGIIIYEKVGIEADLLIKDSYLTKQYMEYDEDKALEYIKKNFKKGKSTFNYEEDIEKLFQTVRNKINEDAAETPTFDTLDLYYFKKKNVGKRNNNSTDILEVRTIKNTDQIITMFPVENKKNIIINELNDEKRYTTGIQRTRKSQIEKFNEKYKKI